LGRKEGIAQEEKKRLTRGWGGICDIVVCRKESLYQTDRENQGKLRPWQFKKET